MMNFASHVTAQIESGSSIGDGSRLGAYCVVRSETILGERCIVDDHALLGGTLQGGKDIVFGAGCYVGPASRLGDRVQIGPHACIDSSSASPVDIRDDVRLGAGAVIRGGILIGDRAVIEPGAIVTRNVPAAAVVAGNPAKIVRYIASMRSPGTMRPVSDSTSVTATGVTGVTVHHLPLVEDLRGNLSFGETMKHVPFEVKRFFLTFEVASEEARGEHAHRTLEQFLLCVHGRVHIMVDDGSNREEFILDRPNIGIHMKPMVWGVQYRFSQGAVLLVLCSDVYEPSDYLRDYAEFLQLRRR